MDLEDIYASPTGAVASRILYLGRDQETAGFIAYELQVGGFELSSLDPGVFYPEVLVDYPAQAIIVDVADVEVEFVEYVREQLALKELSGTPLICLFPPSRSSEVDSFLAAGSSDFIIKPLAQGEVLPRISLALGPQDRQVAWESLESNRERLFAMLRQMEGPAYAVDDRFRLVFMNRSGREIFGEDFLGQDCYRLVYGRETLCKVCTPENREGRPVRRWRATVRDGKEYRFTCSALTNTEGGWEQVVVGSEISREGELRDLGQTFIANVSHDLRAPLTSLDSNLSLLLRGAAGEISSEQKEYLEASVRSTRRLTNLVGNLLDTQKILSGGLRLRFEVQGLSDIIERALAGLRKEAEEKGLYLETSLQPDLPQVYCDGDRVAQVVRALVDNAVKFSSRGTIAIKGRISPSSPDRVQVSVSDESIGIPAGERGKIFDFFYRGEADEIITEVGAGLGLSLAREFVRGHGGTIWVKSEERKGSTFYFTIPAYRPQK